MRLGRLIAVGAVLIAATGVARADEISDSISSAQKLYVEGRLSKAANELNYAVGQIGKKLRQAYLATLPSAPAGWKELSSRSRSQAGLAVFAQGQIIKKSYRQDGAQGRINAELVVDNPMLQALAGMFGNPAMASRMGYERVSLSGIDEKAYLKWDDQGKRGEIVLVMAGRVYIKMSARNLEDPDLLKQMMQAWDIKKIKEIAELK